MCEGGCPSAHEKGFDVLPTILANSDGAFSVHFSTPRYGKVYQQICCHCSPSPNVSLQCGDKCGHHEGCSRCNALRCCGACYSCLSCRRGRSRFGCGCCRGCGLRATVRAIRGFAFVLRLMVMAVVVGFAFVLRVFVSDSSAFQCFACVLRGIGGIDGIGGASSCKEAQEHNKDEHGDLGHLFSQLAFKLSPQRMQKMQ